MPDRNDSLSMRRRPVRSFVVELTDCESISSFREGLAYFSRDGQYGYMDNLGNPVSSDKKTVGFTVLTGREKKFFRLYRNGCGNAADCSASGRAIGPG